MILNYVLFVFLLRVCFCDMTVKYAAIIYRHGDRTPVSTYPTDPWRNESLWPVKFGELTNIGKRQHYALGQWLRKRYSHLLSQNFDPTEIYIRSTDVDRTLMSAQVNLAGLYPPSNESLWNDNLRWQPIPVHTIPGEDDEILAMEKYCITFEKEKERYRRSKAYKDKLLKYQSLMQYLSVHSGLTVKNFYDIESLYSILNIESLYNFTLPDWTHSVFPDKMREPAAISFTDYTATPLMAKIKVGPLLKQIMEHIKDTLFNNSRALKVSMYSAHDLNIGSFLNALRMYDYHCPPYTATILFELIHDNVTNYNYIQISYKNSSYMNEPYVLTIPRCGTKCPVNQFVKLYYNLISVNFDDECEKEFSPFLGLSFLMGLALFASIYVAHRIQVARISMPNGFDLNYTSFPSSTVTHLSATSYHRVVEMSTYSTGNSLRIQSPS